MSKVEVNILTRVGLKRLIKGTLHVNPLLDEHGIVYSPSVCEVKFTVEHTNNKFTLHKKVVMCGPFALINRPGVAGGCSINSLVIHSFSQSVSEPVPPDLHNIINHKQ